MAILLTIAADANDEEGKIQKGFPTAEHMVWTFDDTGRRHVPVSSVVAGHRVFLTEDGSGHPLTVLSTEEV